MSSNLEQRDAHCTLHILPTETRWAIFKLPGVLSPGREMPALIVALRPDYMLYDEALKIYYAKQKCYLNKGNLRSTNRLSPEALYRIRNLHFILSSGDIMSHSFFFHANSIQSFELVFVIGATEEFRYVVTVLDYIGSLAKTSDSLQKVSVYGADWHPIRETIIENVDSRMQVQTRHATTSIEVKGQYFGGPVIWETRLGRFTWKELSGETENDPGAEESDTADAEDPYTEEDQ